jgi:hypothetical protein
MAKFKEYLDSKNKLQEKPIVDIGGDTVGASTNKLPEMATKGKNWKDETAIGEHPKDYTPGTEPWKFNYATKSKGEPGFADDGDKKLVYEPKTPTDFGKEGGKKVTSWPKTGQLKEVMNAVAVGKAANDPHFVTMLVRECKRQGTMHNLLEEIFKHQETFSELAWMLNDEAIRLRLERAMYEAKVQESTDAPASETEEDEVTTRKTKSIKGQKMDLANSDVKQSRMKTK